MTASKPLTHDDGNESSDHILLSTYQILAKEAFLTGTAPWSLWGQHDYYKDSLYKFRWSAIDHIAPQLSTWEYFFP